MRYFWTRTQNMNFMHDVISGMRNQGFEVCTSWSCLKDLPSTIKLKLRKFTCWPFWFNFQLCYGLIFIGILSLRYAAHVCCCWSGVFDCQIHHAMAALSETIPFRRSKAQNPIIINNVLALFVSDAVCEASLVSCCNAFMLLGLPDSILTSCKHTHMCIYVCGNLPKMLHHATTLFQRQPLHHHGPRFARLNFHASRWKTSDNQRSLALDFSASRLLSFWAAPLSSTPSSSDRKPQDSAETSWLNTSSSCSIGSGKETTLLAVHEEWLKSRMIEAPLVFFLPGFPPFPPVGLAWRIANTLCRSCLQKSNTANDLVNTHATCPKTS